MSRFEDQNSSQAPDGIAPSMHPPARPSVHPSLDGLREVRTSGFLPLWIASSLKLSFESPTKMFSAVKWRRLGGRLVLLKVQR